MPTCKSCGKKCDGEYCFQHKPRKALKASKGLTFYVPKEVKSDYEELVKMQTFFMSIWKIKPHKSEISGVSLGSEAMSTYFHHILPKGKHPEAAYDQENIIIMTLEEHTNVENDMYKYEEVNKRREQLKQKYEHSK